MLGATPTRVTELIETLRLVPHPEGGFFREVHRSALTLPHRGLDRAPERPASTMIEFLIVAGNPSRWHRVQTEELWLHLEGAPLAHESVDPALTAHATQTLGRARREEDALVSSPHLVVPADSWQAAHTTGDYSLVACIVAPGFDFADFTLLREEDETLASFRARFPSLTDLI